MAGGGDGRKDDSCDRVIEIAGPRWVFGKEMAG